jgi:hypothetical protein
VQLASPGVPFPQSTTSADSRDKPVSGTAEKAFVCDDHPITAVLPVLTLAAPPFTPPVTASGPDPAVESYTPKYPGPFVDPVLKKANECPPRDVFFNTRSVATDPPEANVAATQSWQFAGTVLSVLTVAAAGVVEPMVTPSSVPLTAWTAFTVGVE